MAITHSCLSSAHVYHSHGSANKCSPAHCAITDQPMQMKVSRAGHDHGYIKSHVVQSSKQLQP